MPWRRYSKLILDLLSWLRRNIFQCFSYSICFSNKQMNSNSFLALWWTWQYGKLGTYSRTESSTIWAKRSINSFTHNFFQFNGKKQFKLNKLMGKRNLLIFLLIWRNLRFWNICQVFHTRQTREFSDYWNLTKCGRLCLCAALYFYQIIYLYRFILWWIKHTLENVRKPHQPSLWPRV